VPTPAFGCVYMGDMWRLGSARVMRQCQVLGVSGVLCHATGSYLISAGSASLELRGRNVACLFRPYPVRERGPQELPPVRVHVAALEHALAGSQVFGTTDSGPRDGSRV
jgi:hypothetical protein